MDVLIDTDALVKATKAGLKRTFCAHFTLHVVPMVEKEAVDEAAAQGLPDAVEIKANLAKRRLKRVASIPKSGPLDELLRGGERQVARALASGAFDAILSDDRAFLRRLEGIDVLAMSPTTAIVYLAHRRRLSARVAREYLLALRPYVSEASYRLAAEDPRIRE